MAWKWQVKIEKCSTWRWLMGSLTWGGRPEVALHCGDGNLIVALNRWKSLLLQMQQKKIIKMTGLNYVWALMPQASIAQLCFSAAPAVMLSVCHFSITWIWFSYSFSSQLSRVDFTLCLPVLCLPWALNILLCSGARFLWHHGTVQAAP